MASFVILHKGELHTVLVDDEDYDRVMASGPWHVNTGSSNTLYAARNVYVNGKQTKRKLHRFLMDAGNLEVDHINGNGLDNRRENLRFATHAENMRNQHKRRDNASGYKGVSLEKRRSKWRAQIKCDGKKIFLGYHTTPESAHDAYCAAAAEMHGEFRRTA